MRTKRPAYETDDETFPADAYTVRGHGGVAWYVMGWETEPGPCEWYDDDAGEWVYDEEPEEVRTGRVVCVMVGDDSRFTFDPEDVAPLAREAYCGSCGQMGCTADGYDREDGE
jgi:hypothetical protein